MPYSTAHFIPNFDTAYLNTTAEKRRVLQLMKFISYSTKMAIKNIIDRRYKNFDAQVSENLCQIRAYQFTLIYEGLTSIELQETFSKVDKIHIESTILLDKYKKNDSGRSNRSEDINKKILPHAFLENYKTDLILSENMYFMISSFILSRYKLVGQYEISHGIDYTKLCHELAIESKTYAKKFIHHLQRNLSKISCQFIFNLQKNIKNDVRLNYLLKALYFKDEIGRHVISCYEVTKIILSHLLRTKKIVKIIAIQIYESTQTTIDFILKPSLCGQYFILEDKPIDNTPAPFVSFTGIVKYLSSPSETKFEYISRFNKTGLEDILLANMAQHPQYAGLLLDQTKHNPYQKIILDDLEKHHVSYIAEAEAQFLRHKHQSKLIGCAEGNEHLFLLTHVRCDNLVSLYHEEQVEQTAEATL